MIDNVDFMKLGVEKYWDFPKNFSGDKKQLVKDGIFSGNYIGSLKKDGEFHRIIIDNETTVQSRGISIVTDTYGDKTAYVPHIIEELNKMLPKGTVLLGEIYYPDLTKNNSDVGSIMRCKPEKAIERQNSDHGKLHYYIFDILAYNGKSLLKTQFINRVKIIKENISPMFKKSKFVEVAEYFEGKELWEELQKGLANGEEGIVMTKKESFYEPDKRPARKTIKVKKELEAPIDVFFTGKYKTATIEYTGKDLEHWNFWLDVRNDNKIQGNCYKEYCETRLIEPVTKNFFYGFAGSLEIAAYNAKTDKIVPIGFVAGLTDEIKEDIVKNNSAYINKPCRVSCMEITKGGALRHPKFIGFRDDIGYKDCTMDKIFEEIVEC